MCVIVTAATNAMPTLSQLAAMSEANPDGIGFAWHDRTGLHRYRNADNMSALGTLISRYRFFTGVPFLLHFRLATNGKICNANTHPFAYSRQREHGYIAHNGIAFDYTHGKYASDSRNAIAAWEHGTLDITTGAQGKFAGIDTNGTLTWYHGQQVIDGEHGTIAVSNLNWQTTDPDTLMEAYQAGYEEALTQLDGSYRIPDWQPHH